LLLALAVLLLPYLVISIYCYPAADDLEYAASALHHGYWFSYIRDYHNWNGRYTDNLFAFASPLLWGNIIAYKLMPVLLYTLTYLSLLLFIKTITDKKIIGIGLQLITLVIFLLYVYNTPSLIESFYWYTGAITYQLSVSATLIYFALLYTYCHCDYYLNKFFHLLLMAILIPFIIGLNEVIMLIMLAFHGVFIFKWFQLRKEGHGIIGFIALLVVIAAAFMIFSPGNEGRAANFPLRHQLFHSLYMTSLQIIRFMFKWIIQIPFITATILFIPVSKYLGEASSFFKNKFLVSPLITFFCLPGIIFLCVFPAYWNMGILGQHRTLNVAYFFFIPLWFMNVHLAVNYVSTKGWQLVNINEKFKPVFALLFLAGLVFTSNGYTVMADLLSKRAVIFDNEMNTRYIIIKAASKAGASEVIVENLSAKPASLYIYDMTCDEEHWINKCYADYFGVERVRLKACD
jgi:hypothetical protein